VQGSTGINAQVPQPVAFLLCGSCADWNTACAAVVNLVEEVVSGAAGKVAAAAVMNYLQVRFCGCLSLVRERRCTAWSRVGLLRTTLLW